MIQANYYPPNGYPYQTCADFRGESTDTKPSDVSEGSTFHEWDTGNEYMFDGSDWLLQSGGGGGGGGGNGYTLLSKSNADSQLVLPDSSFSTPMFYFMAEDNGGGAKAAPTPGTAYTVAPGGTVTAYLYDIPEAKKEQEPNRAGTKAGSGTIYIERYVHNIGEAGIVILDDIEVMEVSQYDPSTGIEITAPPIDFADLGIDAAFISAEYWE